MKKQKAPEIKLEELIDYEKASNDCQIIHERMKVKKVGRTLNSKNYRKEWKVVQFKGYSRLEEIKLPKPHLDKKSTLLGALFSRNSTRDYKKYKISLQEVSSLLYYCVGMKDLTNISSDRFYPSSGGRYPVEIYLISTNTELPYGIYHYFFKNHSLEKLYENSHIPLRRYLIRKEFQNAGLFIIMTGFFGRSTVKYGARAYPLTLMEAGHIGQNIYLISSALHLGCCAIGGFSNYEIDKVLDIDGVNESSLYMFAVGKEK